MLFRLRFDVRGYGLQYQDSIRVAVGGPHAFVVILRHEPGEPPSPDTVVLEVTGDFNPPRRSAEALRDLAQGMLPADSNPEDDLASVIEERRLPAAGRGLRFSELPNPLRDFSREVARQLVSTATDIFGLIRWRRAMPGPIEALWSRGIEGIEWLDDTGNWHRLPPDIQFEIGPAYILPRSTPERDYRSRSDGGFGDPGTACTFSLQGSAEGLGAARIRELASDGDCRP
jgi:hypothetical protein